MPLHSRNRSCLLLYSLAVAACITTASSAFAGLAPPDIELSVDGLIESTNGGIFFPDGSTQGSASKSIRITPGMINLTYSISPPLISIRGSATALGFSADSTHDIHVSIPVPGDWDGTSNFSFRLLWSSPTTTGKVAWKVEKLFLVPGNDVTTAVSGTATSHSPSATANGLTVSPVLALKVTNMQFMVLRISRDTDAPTDTLLDSAYFHGLGIDYNQPPPVF